MTKHRNLQIVFLLTATLAFCLSSAQATTPGTTSSSTAKHKRSTHPASAAKSRGAKNATTSSAPKAGLTKSSAAAKPSTLAKSSPAVKSTGAKSAISSKTGKTGKRGAKSSKGGRQRGQMAPTPERITEIQSALAKNGALDGEPTGKWDDSTTEAMRKYQAAHGLNPSGKLDALTLRQLGLGSATAGLAPPTPMARTAPTNLPTDIQQ